MDKKILIGGKIREIRRKSELTQEQFAEKIGIEPPSLSNIENGKSFPSMQTVLKIMEEFDVLPQEFFDNGYYADEVFIENRIIETLKKQSPEKKRIIYRIIQSFDV